MFILVCMEEKQEERVCVCRMAPEVIACETSTEEPYTCSADIWSFGMLY